MRTSGLQSFCISSIACDRQGSKKLEQRTTPGQGLVLQSYCISTVPGGQMEDDCRDAGGTTPGKEEVELRQEQQPRATQATGR